MTFKEAIQFKESIGLLSIDIFMSEMVWLSSFLQMNKQLPKEDDLPVQIK